MAKVLIVATSRKTMGGITSVIKAHEKGVQWCRYNCLWIETHINKGFFSKILILIEGIIKYLFYLSCADLVHIHLSEPTSAKRKKIFFDLAKLFRKKTIIHFHSFSPDTTICGPHSKLYHYLFTKADVVVVLSNYWKEKVNNAFDLGDKLRVIYNPCIVTTINKSYPKEKYILYAGTLNKRKGYADLISAFAKVVPKHSEWYLVIAGNGEVNEAIDLSRNFGIEDKVKLLGWVDGESKDRAYKEASIFCLPSYAEGFPMAVLDAWAYGLPVITTPVGGIPDVAKDGENLLLFEPGDIDKLTRCLSRLMSDEKLRYKLSKESLLFANTTFNINTINKQIGDLYDELIQ